MLGICTDSTIPGQNALFLPTCPSPVSHDKLRHAIFMSHSFLLKKEKKVGGSGEDGITVYSADIFLQT